MGEQRSGKGRVWAWVAGILVVLLAGGYFGWHYFKKDLASPHSKIAKPLLTDQLKKMITEASDSLYHIEYDQFNLNIDSGRGLITNFKLIPDTAVYHRLVKAHKAPNMVWHIQAEQLVINNFGFKKMPEGRRFTVESMVMRHPVIRAVNRRLPFNDTPRTAHQPSKLLKIVGDLMQITAVRKMALTNMLFTYVNQNEGREKSTTFEHWNVKINDFSFDHAAAGKADTTNAGKALYIKASLFRIATPDSLYHVNFENMLFSPAQKLLSIAHFSLMPRLSRTAFYKAVKFDKDRIQMSFDRVVMRNIDIERILRRQQFHIGNTTIGRSWVEVYNNYHWPKGKRPLRPDAYPHQKLQKLAFDITIDTMRMHNGYFQFVIAARKSEETSKLFMTHMDGLFTNITNNTAAKKRNPYAITRTRALMMGAGNLLTIYKFNLTSANGAFSNTTTMGAMDGRALNALAKPLAQIEVKSANINKMYMHIDANRYKAKGHLDLYYTNLKVNLLKRDDKTDTLKRRGFLSFLTNTFMPNDNPKKNGKFRQGPINVARDQHQSFFELLWKCSLDGMTSATTGFDQKKKKSDGNLIMKLLRKIVKPHKGVKDRNKS
ncbi:hypothetical protein GCM10027037_12710 [Mucilaginibacter koreensis]